MNAVKGLCFVGTSQGYFVIYHKLTKHITQREEKAPKVMAVDSLPIETPCSSIQQL